MIIIHYHHHHGLQWWRNRLTQCFTSKKIFSSSNYATAPPKTDPVFSTASPGISWCKVNPRNEVGRERITAELSKQNGFWKFFIRLVQLLALHQILGKRYFGKLVTKHKSTTTTDNDTKEKKRSCWMIRPNPVEWSVEENNGAKWVGSCWLSMNKGTLPWAATCCGWTPILFLQQFLNTPVSSFGSYSLVLSVWQLLLVALLRKYEKRFYVEKKIPRTCI